MRRDVVIFGHRGYAEKFLENTIISFKEALESLSRKEEN